MPFFDTPQFRLSGLLVGSALLLSGPSAPLCAQHPLSIVQSSTSSLLEPSSLLLLPTEPVSAAGAAVAEGGLPDSPGALLLPQPAQQSSTSQTPPAPQLSDDPDRVSPNGTQQTRRILGIMPNFRSVSADTQLPPMSAKDKFLIAGKDTFDYSSFIIAGIQAGIAMDDASYPEFHQGVKGYARYYWHTLADTTSENFFVGGLGPIVFRQDNRFYTLGHGGFVKRTEYAWTRVLVSRTDDGRATFNFAEIIGSGASSGMSTLWYPKQYQTWTKVGQKWLTSDIIDGANFMLKEFWPDINKYVFHTH
ncbi:MAG: hypothetical protein M3Y50_16340 [Acidobacteriota bacterium]|nr:hypothetical protein [Acidobacteriota bacterium]